MTIHIRSTFSSIIRPNTNTLFDLLFGPNRIRMEFGTALIFAHSVYFQRIRVKFVYERHQVKVKLTEAKRWKMLSPQCETSIDNNSASIRHRAIRFACTRGFSQWQIKWCDRYLCPVTGRDHA